MHLPTSSSSSPRAPLSSPLALSSPTSQHVDAGRIVVFHAAPLVEHVPSSPYLQHSPVAPGAEPDAAAVGAPRTPGGAQHAAEADGAAAPASLPKLTPIAFSKRLGLRAWRKLRSSLGSLRREIKISLETATEANLVGALQQSGQPILHFLPTRDYEHGISMESYDGELKPLPLAQLQLLLERAAPRRPSLVFLYAVSPRLLLPLPLGLPPPLSLLPLTSPRLLSSVPSPFAPLLSAPLLSAPLPSSPFPLPSSSPRPSPPALSDARATRSRRGASS